MKIIQRRPKRKTKLTQHITGIIQQNVYTQFISNQVTGGHSAISDNNKLMSAKI